MLLLHGYVLLPTVVVQLVSDISVYSEGAIVDLFVDVALAVVAEHVDVEPVFGVLVADPCLFEMVFLVRFGTVKPITESVVDRYGIAVSQVKQEVRFVHTEIFDTVILILRG
jgi:hypothetical protein